MSWNRPTEKRVEKRKKNGWLVARAAIFAVIVAATLVTWLLCDQSTPEKESTFGNKSIRDAKPTIKIAKSRETAKTGIPKIDEAMAKLDAIENRPVEIVKAKATPPPITFSFESTNTVFQNSVEQLMSIVFTTMPGNMPMPLPKMNEEDRKNIAGILVSQTSISDNDSDEVKMCKETVAMAKKEMIGYIKQGGDPDSFLDYFQQQLINAFELRTEARNQAIQLCEDDPELAEQFISKVNSRFNDDGILPLNRDEIMVDDDGELIPENKNDPVP